MNNNKSFLGSSLDNTKKEKIILGTIIFFIVTLVLSIVSMIAVGISYQGE